MTQIKNIIAWDDGVGGAGAIGAAFSDGHWFTNLAYNVVIFDILMASTVAPTNIEAQLQISPDGGATVMGPLEVENAKAAGIAERQDGVFQQVSTADGHHSLTIDGLVQGMSYRLQLRTADGTAPTAYVLGYLGVA